MRGRGESEERKKNGEKSAVVLLQASSAVSKLHHVEKFPILGLAGLA
jgi:hypothetical protein